MSAVQLIETSHPSREAAEEYDALVGLEREKEALLGELEIALEPERLRAWQQRHHPSGLDAVSDLLGRPPAVLLAGDVGCGKTALARAIGTPLATRLDRRIVSMEAPTDLRGHGLVGEISARITAAFDQARRVAGSGRPGILILDEVDDLGTARAQTQAHHEDRAGLNALIRQLDSLKGTSLAVILITNRPAVLDPALRRRVSLELPFRRPGVEVRVAMLQRALGHLDPRILAEIAESLEGFSPSDIRNRVLPRAIWRAYSSDRPVELAHLEAAISETRPSPRIRPEDLR